MTDDAPLPAGATSVLDSSRAITELFVVYERPLDLPYPVVVRRWTMQAGEFVPDATSWLVGMELGSVRLALRSLRPDLVRTERHASDDPVIREVWL